MNRKFEKKEVFNMGLRFVLPVVFGMLLLILVQLLQSDIFAYKTGLISNENKDKETTAQVVQTLTRQDIPSYMQLTNRDLYVKQDIAINKTGRVVDIIGENGAFLMELCGIKSAEDIEGIEIYQTGFLSKYSVMLHDADDIKYFYNAFSELNISPRTELYKTLEERNELLERMRYIDIHSKDGTTQSIEYDYTNKEMLEFFYTEEVGFNVNRAYFEEISEEFNDWLIKKSEIGKYNFQWDKYYEAEECVEKLNFLFRKNWCGGVLVGVEDDIAVPVVYMKEDKEEYRQLVYDKVGEEKKDLIVFRLAEFSFPELEEMYEKYKETNNLTKCPGALMCGVGNMRDFGGTEDRICMIIVVDLNRTTIEEVDEFVKSLPNGEKGVGVVASTYKAKYQENTLDFLN